MVKKVNSRLRDPMSWLPPARGEEEGVHAT